jgi:hypothetical protein
MPMRQHSGKILAAALTLLSATPALAELSLPLRFNGDLGVGYDGNVANSQNSGDIRESSLVTGGLHSDYHYFPNLYTTVLVRGSLQGEFYDQYDKLSNGKATAMLRGLYRPNGDFYTPGLAAWASVAYWKFGSKIRESNEYRGGVFASEQLTTQVSGRLGFTVSRRDSASRVFDLTGWSTALNLDWLVTPLWTVYGEYRFYHGDVVSTGSASGPYKTVLAAEVIEPDDAFGGLAGGQNAYRFDADAHIATLGVNRPLTPMLSVDAQAQYIDTRAGFDNEYRRWIGIVSVLARFGT